MSELKILFVTSDRFPPFRPAASVIFGHEFGRRGHRVDCLVQASSVDESPGPRPWYRGFAYLASIDDGSSLLRRARKRWLEFRNDLKVISMARHGEYSLIQVKDKFLTALPALAAAKLSEVPFFYWLAFPYPEASIYSARRGFARYRLYSLLLGTVQKWILYRLLMPSARHVFVQSEQMRRDVANHGIPLNKTTAVPSSVIIERMHEIHREQAVEKPPGKKWLLYLGTLRRERGLALLIDVLAKVLVNVPEAHLVLVGAGDMPEDEAHLLAEAKRASVEQHITITGWLPMQEARAWIRAADVCLSPYLPIEIFRSTSPTKLVEYMAIGKPVVGNDHPEQSAVLGESGGGYACPWDAECFAAAVLRLFGDPGTATAMGEAGRRYVETRRSSFALADLVEKRYREHLPGSEGAYSSEATTP